MPLSQLSTVEGALQTLANDFFNLFANGATFSDVTFSVEGRQVQAHRCVLAARSNFFRMLFCKGEFMAELGAPQIIPISMVRYEVFIVLLQFLYSGRLVSVSQQGILTRCPERGCQHTHCSCFVNLALDILQAASTFSVDQLVGIIQDRLITIVDKISIGDVLQVLMAAKKHKLVSLWDVCLGLVANSVLTSDNIRKHLPSDVATKIEHIRLQALYGVRFFGSRDADVQEQRIRRMRQALDSSDVELVKLMVLGEGIDLDKALALHYSVTNCTRDVVKALLELGAVDVNYQGFGGLTALHLASQEGSPDMIGVLLDHHACPHLRSEDGKTPLDVLLRLSTTDCSLAARGSMLSSPPSSKLSRCLKMLQAAVCISCKKDRDDASCRCQTESRWSGMVPLVAANPDCYSTPLTHTGRTSSSERNSGWASEEGSSSFEQQRDDFTNDHDASLAATMHKTWDSSMALMHLNFYPGCPSSQSSRVFDVGRYDNTA